MVNIAQATQATTSRKTMGVRFDVTRQSYFERVLVLLLFHAYRSLVIFLGVFRWSLCTA